MYGCESWPIKKAEHQRIDAFELCVVLEKTLESPLDCKEIQVGHPKGDQSWVFISRTNVEAETSILWSPDVKSWLIWKDPDAGKDWGQEEKQMTEDEMAGWHHLLNEHEFWVNSGSWWWTGKPGVLQSMGSQRVGHDWVTELYWTVVNTPDLRQIINSLIWQPMKHENPGPCTVTIRPIKVLSQKFYLGPWRKQVGMSDKRRTKKQIIQTVVPEAK